LKDVKGNKEAYPRGGDCKCKGPVEGLRSRKKGSVAATPERNWTDLDSGLCYKVAHMGP